MKKLTIAATVALCGVEGILAVPPAHAGNVAPDGFYVGAQVGYGTTLYDGSNRSAQASDTYVQDFGSYNEPRLGGFVGYSKSFGRWVLAPEVKAVHDDAELEIWPTRDFQYTLTKEHHFGVGLRLGYRVDGDILLYARGDALRGKFVAEFTGDGTHDSRYLNGFDAGFGADIALGGGVFLRGEYLWADYGDLDRPAESYQPFEGMAHLAIGYSFGGGAARRDGGRIADFGGVYVGAQLGYGDANSKEFQTDQTTSDTFYYGRPAHGLNGGVYGGYGTMLSRFYVGGEIEVGLVDYEMREAVADGSRAGWRMKYAYGAAGRLGYRIADSALFYVKAGIARAGVEYEEAGTSGKEEELTGLRGGIGMEFAVADHMTVRGEYTHTSYEKMSYTDASGAPNELKPRENLFRVGAAYKF